MMKQVAYADYADYAAKQAAVNRRSLHRTWAMRENIAALAQYVKAAIPGVRFGLCHGTRRGDEQAWFREFLGCEVLGTEISDTAAQFPHTIQWDFHEVKPEWLGAVDFIYSNSLDHSYDPRKALTAWMSCLRPGGLCIVEHSDAYLMAGSRRDPFSASLPELLGLVAGLGYRIRGVLDAPAQGKCANLRHIVIEAGS